MLRADQRGRGTKCAIKSDKKHPFPDAEKSNG
jgi:hypothetical protein